MGNLTAASDHGVLGNKECDGGDLVRQSKEKSQYNCNENVEQI